MNSALVPEPATLPEALTQLSELQFKNQQLLWRVKQLEKQLYGPKSDRPVSIAPTVTEQILMDQMFGSSAEPPASQGVVLPELPPPAPRQRAPRKHRPQNVETITERIEPEEKICPHCGKTKCEIGCERSERYEYIPAKVIRHEIIRPKLACGCGEGSVAIAPLPPMLVERGSPGASLVAHVIVSKFEDHLSLYHLQRQLADLGVDFSRQDLCNWVGKAAWWGLAIVRQLKKELLAGDYLQVDETPVRVLDPEVRGRCATGYLWVAGRPRGTVIFEFYPGRGKEYAEKLICNFKGHLQRDGYGVYGALARGNPGLIPCGCWSHARRKFVDAAEELPQQSLEIIQQIRRLYAIERHAREEDLTPEQRHRLRGDRAPLILSEIRQRLESVEPRLLPQSPLGKAVRYALNEWEPLNTFLQDGKIELDNNLIENAIRPSAIGKKRWLFIGHPSAGWRSAVIYSITVTCRRLGIDPAEYLRDVLARLPGATNRQIPELTPARWKAARDQAVEKLETKLPEHVGNLQERPGVCQMRSV
jgi:transposase